MSQNILFQFPVVDLICLHRTVRENTQRILRFVREYKEYLKRCDLHDSSGVTVPISLNLGGVPNRTSCSENVSLNECDIFNVNTDDVLNENDCTAVSDVAEKQCNSAISSFESNKLSRKMASKMDLCGSRKDFENLKTAICPTEVQAEQNADFLPTPKHESNGIEVIDCTSDYGDNGDDDDDIEIVYETINNVKPKTLFRPCVIRSLGESHQRESVIKKEICEDLKQEVNEYEYEDITIEYEKRATGEQYGPKVVEEQCEPEMVDEQCEPEMVDEQCEPEVVDEQCEPEEVDEQCEPEVVEEPQELSFISPMVNNVNPVYIITNPEQTINVPESHWLRAENIISSPISTETLGLSHLNPESSIPDSSQPLLMFSEMNTSQPTFLDLTERGIVPLEDVLPSLHASEATNPAFTTPALITSENMEPLLIMPQVSRPLILTPAFGSLITNSGIPESPLIQAQMSTPNLVTSVVPSTELDSSPKFQLEMTSPLESTNAMSSPEGVEYTMVVPQEITPVLTSPQNVTPPMTSPDFSKNLSPSPEDVENAMITPKKTKDITKIKGWRRKQFFIEKPGTPEFSFNEDEPVKKEKKKKKKRKKKDTRKKKKELHTRKDTTKNKVNEKVENAFVCDSLDRFLDAEANLNINYEIPHLFAEVGIKLTSEDVVSRPNVSKEDIKQMGNRYCVPIQLSDDTSKLVKSGHKRGVKRKLSQASSSSKSPKLDKKNLSKVSGKKAGKSSESVKLGETEEIVNKSNRTDQGSTLKKTVVLDLANESTDGQFTNKLLGLAVYPGPNAPLHPVVQNHLDKIRCNQTEIDKNWANFVVSALVTPKTNKYKRMIVPVHCGVKEPNSPEKVSSEMKDGVQDLMDDVCTERSQEVLEPTSTNVEDVNLTQGTQLIEQPENPEVVVLSEKTRNVTKELQKIYGKNVELKECKIVVKKLESMWVCRVWCMEHNCYNCDQCGFSQNTLTVKIKTSAKDATSSSTFVISSPVTFDQDIAKLLAQKLHDSELSYSQPTAYNIDKLRKIVPNALEIIKLSLLRHNYETGYINIWYLKPDSYLDNKSQVFLTFSKFRSVPHAINVKSYSKKISDEKLPNFITELFGQENSVDEYQYAILYCDGRVWEIHGCLTCSAPGKEIEHCESSVEREQVFTPHYLPELDAISVMGKRVINEPGFRWWVLDLTQKFSCILSKLGTQTRSITRKDILNFIRSRVFGFLTLNKIHNRVVWIYVIQKILPFVLIGPYKLSEPHNLTLQKGLDEISFSYYGELMPSPNFPLKFFINTVIANVKESDKELIGLWLCDKIEVDKTCFLEMIVSTRSRFSSNEQHNIDMEHAYSACALDDITSNSPSCLEGKSENLSEEIFLYFQIFELGYLKGELLRDDTVIMENPLDKTLISMPSCVIGDWFITLMKERMQFTPSDLKVMWYVTKNMDELEGRKPFNKLFLDGAHMLCEAGPYYLMKLNEDKVGENGVEKGDIDISGNLVVQEAAVLKKLEYILYGTKTGNIDIERLLKKAVMRIHGLNSLSLVLEQDKDSEMYKKFELGSKFLNVVNNLPIDEKLKKSFLDNIKPLFYEKGKDRTNDSFSTVLESFGKKYCATKRGQLLTNSKENSEEQRANMNNEQKETKKIGSVTNITGTPSEKSYEEVTSAEKEEIGRDVQPGPETATAIDGHQNIRSSQMVEAHKPSTTTDKIKPTTEKTDCGTRKVLLVPSVFKIVKSSESVPGTSQQYTEVTNFIITPPIEVKQNVKNHPTPTATPAPGLSNLNEFSELMGTTEPNTKTLKNSKRAVKNNSIIFYPNKRRSLARKKW